MITLQALCFGILGYLLGATPYGLIIARVFCHTDPRTGGSHNTGATNVARMCGFGWGVATLACDLLKGALPVFLAQMETGSPVLHAHPALPLRGLSVAAAFPLRAGHRGLAAQGEY